MTRWYFLETLSKQIAVPAVWSWAYESDYPAFKSLCLVRDNWQVESYPCPHECGCWHRVILTNEFLGLAPVRHPEFLDLQVAVGACRCADHHCPDIPLTLRQITPLKLNWPKLCREICQAFSLRPKYLEMPMYNTRQIGHWAGTVPVFFTIQENYPGLRAITCELGMRTHMQPYILFAPSGNLLTAPCHEYLGDAKAGFLTLEATTTLRPDGTLMSNYAPGKLFGPWTPEPKETDENSAERVIALLKTLEGKGRMQPPSPLVVFRLYCVDNLSASEIAEELHCSRATVFGRLSLIREKTGVDPDQFRRISSHVEKIEESLSDSRASHIHRKRAIDDEANEEEE